MGHGGSSDGRPDVSRRKVLQQGAALGLLWTPLRKLTALDFLNGDGPADAHDVPPPANFPAGIELYRQAYENWSLEIRVDDVWTCTPCNAQDVVTLANWAHANGWRLRPSGSKHGWSPFTVLPEQRADLKVLLVDTTKHLTAVEVGTRDGHHVVTVGAGALMDDVLVAMQGAGRGWTSVPAAGDITIAGAIAINGHGAALPALGEDTAGFSFGSMSNRVLSLDAVVWDRPSHRYVIRTFERDDRVTKAVLTSMGRVFITGYTLTTEPLTNLRCISYTDIPGDEILAAPGSPGRTFESFTDQAGRLEVIWFPGTESPWLKVWSVEPTKPAASREVTDAYNYPFSDNIPVEVARLVNLIMNGHPEATPQFGQTCLQATTVGLAAFQATDIWGPARNTQHYIKPTTLRAGEFGWTVITARHNVQRVLFEFMAKVKELNARYEARGLWPQNMPIELRCSSVDTVAALEIDGAEPPVLSGTTPDDDHPEWDSAVWLNILSLPETPGVYEYKTELEQWVIDNYTGEYATCRVEWSKGWAFTPERDFLNDDVIDNAIPDSLRRGRPNNADWDWAIARLDELDPHDVFGNPFTDRLLK